MSIISEDSPNLAAYKKNKSLESLLHESCLQTEEYNKRYRKKLARQIEKRAQDPLGDHSHLYLFTKRADFRCTLYKIIQLSLKYPDGIPVSKLIHIIGLSGCQYKYYSKYMLDNGLITQHIDWFTLGGKRNGNPKRIKFKPTEKGLKYLHLYNGLKYLFNVSDGLNLFGYDSI